MILLQEDDFFEEALASRRAKFRYRLIISALIGLGFSALGNWPWLIVWYLTYVAVNVIDDRFLIWRAAQPRERRRRIVLRPCVGTGLSNLVFVALALPAPASHGAWGVLALAFLIGGITLYSIMAARASRRSFISVMLPLGAGFLSLPIFAHLAGGGSSGVVVTAIGGVLTISAAISHWRDSAEVRRAEQTARARAEAGEAAKTRFLAMVSHDLRTPLMAIRAGAEQVAAEGGDKGLEPIVDHARLIEDAAGMMRRLLDDLLDMFKTEAGQMKISPESTDLGAVATDMVRFWEASAAAKGLSLHLEIAPDMPEWVAVDATRLRQILNNLVSNALKFTHLGQVTLSVRRDDGVLNLIVSDTGAGLSPDEQAALFQPYAQGVEGLAHGGGTGLGLVISRDLARVMGGDLTLDSVKGQGATFTLSVPYVRCDAPVVPNISRARSEDLSVLVVDDHPINLKALGLMLDAVVRHPVFASSGAEALVLLSRGPFDLVLMDINMPGMDGWETTRRLRRASGPNRSTPVIAVTGSASAADIAACRLAGMDGWVAKPIGPGELFAEMERVLSDPRTNGTESAAA